MEAVTDFPRPPPPNPSIQIESHKLSNNNNLEALNNSRLWGKQY